MTNNIQKITKTQMDELGVCAAPDVLTGTPEENKKIFDRLCREAVIPSLNALIDELELISNDAEEDREYIETLKQNINNLQQLLGDVESVSVNGETISEKLNSVINVIANHVLDIHTKIGELGRLNFSSTSIVNALNYLSVLIMNEGISFVNVLPEPYFENYLKICKVFDFESTEEKLYMCKASFPATSSLEENTICERIYFDQYLVKERISAFRKKYQSSFRVSSNGKKYVNLLEFTDTEGKKAYLQLWHFNAKETYVLVWSTSAKYDYIWSSDDYYYSGSYFYAGFSKGTSTDAFSGFTLDKIYYDIPWLFSKVPLESQFYWEEVGKNNDLDIDFTLTKEGRYSTITMKNGETQKSVVIEDGIAGYTPQKGKDYFTQEEITDISKTVEENLKEEIISNSRATPLFVDDISQCTDTDKYYVLPDGFIYAYMTKKQIIFHDADNKFNSSDCLINKRMEVNTLIDEAGYIWTGPIAVDMSKETPFRIKIEGTKLLEDTSTNQKLWLCADDSGTDKLSASIILLNNYSSNYTTLLPDGTVYADYKGNARLDDSIISQTRYIRIGFKYSDEAVTSKDDVLGVSITFPHEAYSEEKTVTGWLNTNFAFVPADYEDIIAQLEAKSQHNAERLYKVEQQLINMDYEKSFPIIWTEAVDNIIENIKLKQNAFGRNGVTFAWFSDNHQRLGHVGALISHVMKKCSIPFAFYTGDSGTNNYEESENIIYENEEAFSTTLGAIPQERFNRALGNYDGYYSTIEGKKYHLPWEIKYRLFMSPLASFQNKVFGGDGTYYYTDDKASKTRFIVLNSVWFDYQTFSDGTVNNVDGNGFGSEQINWLIEVLLDVPADYEVAFLSHCPISNNDHSYLRDGFIVEGIINAFIKGESYLGSYTGAKNENNHVVANVTFTQPHNVIGWFAGHIHKDMITDTNEIYGSQLDFKCVTITSDANITYDSSEPARDMNGDTSHAIDFVTVNKKTGEVYLARLGIGSDRQYLYK